MDSFGKRLKKIRHTLGITQNDFAKACDVKLTAISKYETELIKPGFEMLQKIATVYNINLNWLILGEGEQFLNTVCLKNGTNDELIPVTEKITTNNTNFTIKSYEKTNVEQLSKESDNDEDIISLLINLASKLSQNPEAIEQLKNLNKSLK